MFLARDIMKTLDQFHGSNLIYDDSNGVTRQSSGAALESSGGAREDSLNRSVRETTATQTTSRKRGLSPGSSKAGQSPAAMATLA